LMTAPDPPRILQHVTLKIAGIVDTVIIERLIITNS
jgi:hypothetical protein